MDDVIVSLRLVLQLERAPPACPSEARTLAALGESQKSKSPSGDARGGGGLGSLTHARAANVGRAPYFAVLPTLMEL
jgi:hypothetical protein